MNLPNEPRACPPAETIDAWLDGEATPSVADEAHLSTCGRCADLVARRRAVSGALRPLAGLEPSSGSLQATRARLEARLRRRPAPRRRLVVRISALAAGFLVAQLALQASRGAGRPEPRAADPITLFVALGDSPSPAARLLESPEQRLLAVLSRTPETTR